MHKKRKLQEAPQCSICLEDLGDNASCLLACQHRFHSSCICQWILENNSCPECRTVVNRCQHVPLESNLPNFIGSHAPEIVSLALSTLLATNEKNKREIQCLQDELLVANQSVTFYVLY